MVGRILIWNQYKQQEQNMVMKNIKIKLLDPKAEVPSRAHATDSGYDLTFIGVHKIVRDVIFFKTGISVQPPRGYYFESVPRSSISKLPLAMANSVGIIDESYTGEIFVPVRVMHSIQYQDFAHSNYPNGIVKIFGLRPQTMPALADLIVKNKPKLFQLILKKRNDCKFVLEDLSDTERADGGFGSTDSK
jgi:dUTPase